MSKEVQLECQDHYHDWKFQIRKEIKEAESEQEKSDLSTDQYFRCISLLKNPINTRPDGLEL